MKYMMTICRGGETHVVQRARMRPAGSYVKYEGTRGWLVTKVTYDAMTRWSADQLDCLREIF